MSVTSAIYDYATSTTQQRANEAKNAGYGASTEDFLKLLVVQLTNQDPLNPMEDMDFTSQLAQLQSLEEQMAMTKSINAMRMDSQVQSATAMIGKEVIGTDKNGDAVSGIVSRVVQTAEDIFVELANGTQISVSNVTSVTGGSGSLGSDLANSANAIGMWIEAGLDSAMQPIKGIVENVSVVDGKVMLQLYGGKSVSWDQVTKMRAPTDDEIWYTLPDELREQVEKAQAMVNLTVTGTSTDGAKVTGIVANAELNGGKVYLILHDGTRIPIEDVEGEPSMPTAEDATRDLTGKYAVGLDREGNKVEGAIVGAEDRDDGLVLLLEDGKEVYYEFLTEIRDAKETGDNSASS